MRFLIIDDDDYKVEQFTKHLTKEDKFTIKNSYCTGLTELVTNRGNYDCLLLDMNFPHFDNEQVRSNEGIRVLHEIKRKKIDIPVVIYSSKCVDVSEFTNVKDYIVFSGMYSLKERVNLIKNRFKKLFTI